jgi:hypothetical protein
VLIWALTLVDLFRRDWSTGKKCAWAIIMLVLPVVGVLAYVIVRPPSASDIEGVVGAGDPSAERFRDHHPV